jgi:hypothetical protein
MQLYNVMTVASVGYLVLRHPSTPSSPLLKNYQLGVYPGLVARIESDSGGYPRSRRRAGSDPAPSRGVLLARDERSILL